MCTSVAEKVESKTLLTAYKVLSVGLDGSITTPFVRCDITEEMLKGEEELVAGEGEAPETVVDGKRVNVTLGAGYIHTYADKKSLVYDYFNYYERHAGVGYWETAYRVFEVEIPMDGKKDECWEGIFDDDRCNRSYASKRIRFKREIGIDELQEWREKMIKEGELIVGMTGALYGKITDKNNTAMDMETKKEKTYNIYYLEKELIVTDDTPHAIDQYIADKYGFDPEDDDDFDRILDIGGEVLEVATGLKIEQVEIASVDDFKDDVHAVCYRI